MSKRLRLTLKGTNQGFDWSHLMSIWPLFATILTSLQRISSLQFYPINVWLFHEIPGHLTLRKIAIWLSKNCQKTFFWKKWKFLAILLKKMSSFWQFFDSQMAIFRRVRCTDRIYLLTFASPSVISSWARILLLKQVIWGHTDQTWGTRPTPTAPQPPALFALRPTAHLTAVTAGALDCGSWRR